MVSIPRIGEVCLLYSPCSHREETLISKKKKKKQESNWETEGWEWDVSVAATKLNLIERL